MDTKQIEIRYNDLAEDTCCLSCGGAINHSKAKPEEICVDLGSGRGTDVLRLAEEVGEKGFVYGIDVSDEMLKKAERSASKLGVNNVKFIKSELETLPLEDNSVDLIISNCTINHAENKQKVWSEIYRILKKGGRFVVSDIYSKEEVPEEFRNDPVAISECWAGSVTRYKYLDQLRIAGFSSIDIIEESKPYEKGKIEVSSWTIAGIKKACCCC
jgi:ubiquinone/menaquinone biosynthesis C-methylase UbiE